ncbi:MAG: rhomboid family intramembrane serine protease [Myxococcota bacterium]|nr:rhomboid family intramembrane serine protease [Myxococcota bacterium]
MYGRQQVSFGPPSTPDVIKYLMIANVGVFILQHLIQGFTVWLAVTPKLVWQGGFIWQPFTYMWLHSESSLLHIGFNMLALWMFGSPVASAWGERAFLRYYLLCGIGAGFIIASWPALLTLFGMQPLSYVIPTLGASGAVFGVLLAFSFIWPDRTIMLLFPPIPIKAIWFIPLILGMELISPRGNVSTVGHLGGVVAGWILLRRMGINGGITFLEWQWRRWKMRRNLKAATAEERARKRWNNDDRTFH